LIGGLTTAPASFVTVNPQPKFFTPLYKGSVH
jgi:hypothetical protein